MRILLLICFLTCLQLAQAVTVDDVQKKYGFKQKIWLFVKIDTQCLSVVQDGKVTKNYAVSTAKNGIGNTEGSGKTPLGLHRIIKKVGDGAPPLTIFKGLKPIGIYSPEKFPNPADYLTTRVLVLEGSEEGINRGKGIDSYLRGIMVHGTVEEDKLGTPASHGCIRLKNSDIIDLFDTVSLNTPLYIAR